MATLSSTFLKTALSPLHYANVCIMGKIVTSGLRELAAENLRAKLNEAIKQTAQRAGVRTRDVEKLLPMDQFAALERYIHAQQVAAVAEWKDRPVESRRMGNVAALTTSGAMPNLPTNLQRLAELSLPAVDFANAATELSKHVASWQSTILECGKKLDDDGALAAAHRRRLLRRIALAVVLLGGVGVGVWFWLQIEAARERVNAQIGASDACAVASIADGDLEEATDDQKHQVEQRKQACELKRAQEREAAEVQAKRQAYEKRCADAATDVSQGDPPSDTAGFDGAEVAFLGRVAKKALTVDDLGPKEPTFPCADTPSKDAFGAPFEQAVIASKAWLDSDRSARVTAILKANSGALSEETKDEVDDQAEKLAAKALIQRDPPTILRAKRMCRLKTTLKLDLGSFCRGL